MAKTTRSASDEADDAVALEASRKVVTQLREVLQDAYDALILIGDGAPLTNWHTRDQVFLPVALRARDRIAAALALGVDQRGTAKGVADVADTDRPGGGDSR